MIPVTALPSNDAQLIQWTQNFLTRITAAPATYGLTAALCTSLSGFLSAFTATVQANVPDLRCRASVTARNQAKVNLVYNIRLMANTIYGQAAVTDTMKQQLGLTVRAIPTPIPAPSSSPVIEVLSVSAWTVSIRLRAADGSTRGKIAGASGASIFSYVGTQPPADIAQWKFEGNTGRVKAEVLFPSALVGGTKVWLTAFWFNGRKQSGPACSPVSTQLQAGGVQTMAA